MVWWDFPDTGSMRAVLAEFESGAMERAPWPAGELRPIEEDAGAFDQPGNGRFPSPAAEDPSTVALLGELPLFGRQRLGGRLHAGSILVTGEVRAVRAAPLGHSRSRAREDALATATVEAFPVREKECHVKAPRTLFFGILKGDPFVSISGREAPVLDTCPFALAAGAAAGAS